jgi:hypothetical protein
MASKIVLPDTMRKVGAFGELKAPGSELTCQARLLTGKPAQRAGKEGVPARPALPQLLPEHWTTPVTFIFYAIYNVQKVATYVFASKFLSNFSNKVLISWKKASISSFQSICQASFHFIIILTSKITGIIRTFPALIHFHLIWFKNKN